LWNLWWVYGLESRGCVGQNVEVRGWWRAHCSWTAVSVNLTIRNVMRFKLVSLKRHEYSVIVDCDLVWFEMIWWIT
jgi:hypothetical protein